MMASSEDSISLWLRVVIPTLDYTSDRVALSSSQFALPVAAEQTMWANLEKRCFLAVPLLEAALRHFCVTAVPNCHLGKQNAIKRSNVK
jgi:hypothetical protein